MLPASAAHSLVTLNVKCTAESQKKARKEAALKKVVKTQAKVEPVAGKPEGGGAGEVPRGFALVYPGLAAEQEVRQYHPARILVVALDVGKDVHHLYIRSGAYVEVVAPTKISSLAAGYGQVIEVVDGLMASGAYDLVLLGHEPTGVYHEAWSYALATHYHAHRTGQATPALRYRQLNPALVKQERQRKTHRQRKTDVIDVAAIAELLGAGSGNPVLCLREDEMRLRVLLQHLRTAGKAHLRQAIQLRTTLDRLWPGTLGDSKAYAKAHPSLPPLLHLVDSRPLERESVRLLLTHCPNPYHLRALGEQGIRHLFHAQGATCGPKTAHRIYTVAQQSLLPPPAMVALLAEQVQAEFALYCTYESRIAAGESQAAELLAHSEAACLLTFPGLGSTLVARYLAALADLSRFRHAGQIWSFAGCTCASSRPSSPGSIRSLPASRR
jgi:transposase